MIFFVPGATFTDPLTCSVLFVYFFVTECIHLASSPLSPSVSVIEFSMLSMYPLSLFGITSRLAHNELRCIKNNLTFNKKNTINKCMPSSDVVMRRIADVVVHCFIWIY